MDHFSYSKLIGDPWYFRDYSELLRLQDDLYSPAVKKVASVYATSISHNFWILNLPFFVYLEGINNERAEWLAREQVTGSARQTNHNLDTDSQIQELKQRFLLGQSRPDCDYPLRQGGSASILDEMDPVVCRQLEPVAYVLMTSIWTTFEIMAGDLWKAALNADPAGLGQLKGTKTRIGKATAGGTTRFDDGRTAANTSKGKDVSLSHIQKITKGSCDLSRHMGDLLCDRFKVQSLRGIRIAYSTAFSEKNNQASTVDIDTSLASNWLDALAAVRNLVVHRAGIADSDYIIDQKATPHAPLLQEGDQLTLSGEHAARMICEVTKCGVKLVTSVDKWLEKIGDRCSN